MSYYKEEDLGKFSEVGEFSPELMESFFSYYNSATAEGKALTPREKSLIALAIAHSKKCPYCIDAFTSKCLESGCNPMEMTEALHVAAAMDAGITLVHGVQMKNAMKKLGV